MLLEEKRKQFEDGQQFVVIMRKVLNAPDKKKMSFALMEAFDVGYSMGFSEGASILKDQQREEQ